MCFFLTRNYIYYTRVSCVWFLLPYVILQSDCAWKPFKVGLSISFSLCGFSSLLGVSAVTKLVYKDASRKVSVGLYTFVASYYICFQSRNASWLSSHKCSTHEGNFTFTRKRTDNEERNEIGVSLSDPTSSLATSAYSTETWLIINIIPKNICMSFTKYVEVVENSAFINMLPAEVTV